MSKPIAATALARMTNDKQIDLDASFYEYVPITPKNGGTLLFVNWRAIQLVSGDIEVLNTD
ncbi:beta-lactamase family protein [Pareuzebyella sediminis]|uniref:beta-lactamase family protein n=1 Tax=Pareuzebyella sediminis TaxID=2607998 RepID=UPI0011EC859A